MLNIVFVFCCYKDITKLVSRPSIFFSFCLFVYEKTTLIPLASLHLYLHKVYWKKEKLKMICQVGLALFFGDLNIKMPFEILPLSSHESLGTNYVHLLRTYPVTFFTCHPGFHVKNIHWGIFCYHIQRLCTL